MSKFIPVCEPFLDGNELSYITEAVKTGWISSSGKFVAKFEEEFAKYCDTKYGVAVTNGTAALHLGLKALGVGEGDEVIIPDFTMIATAFAVCYTGAVPIFVDSDKDTWNIDWSKIEEKITPKTKAIIPVHIFGYPCEMDEINEIAKRHNLYVLEDAAESHGALYKGRKTGSLGDIAAFSFYANKILTTGEGGAVVTNNEDFYKQVKYYKNMCFPLDGPRNYIHNDIGFNYRMSNIHAAIALAQVEKADEYREMRIKNGTLYRDLLQDVDGISFQKEESHSTNVYWMNSVKLDPKKFGRDREEVVTLLKEKGIDTRVLFVGMHRQPSLLKYGVSAKGDFSASDDLAANGFYLPSASSLQESDIEYICNTIKELSR